MQEVSTTYRPEATRRDLLEAAHEEFWRVGFRSASVDQILTQTGVTKAALYHHFRNKLELGYAVVDEILRGTNTRERVLASRAVIRTLAGSRSAGLVTSHELALAQLEEELPTLRNVHFRESIGPEGMSFDYLMHEGPVTSSNALEVLRREGVDLDFDAEEDESSST